MASLVSLASRTPVEEAASAVVWTTPLVELFTVPRRLDARRWAPVENRAGPYPKLRHHLVLCTLLA